MGEPPSYWFCRGSHLNPEGIHVKFVENNVELGQVSLQVLELSPFIIIPSVLHIQ